MAFTVSNLVQNVLNILGQVDPIFGLFDATGGSATTFVNSSFNNYDNQPQQDDFKNYLAIVTRDAGGAGASPEGRWGIVSGYVDTTWTGTIATVTDAIAAGDTIMLAKQDKFPLPQIVFAINKALEELGDLPSNADTTLATVANQTEYDIPVVVKRGLKQVWVQGRIGFPDDNQWVLITDKRNELTAGGSASILYLPKMSAGYTIKLIYDGPHPVVSAYNTAINEYIHPTVATCMAVIKVLEWYNRRDENQDPDSFFLQLEQIYAGKLAAALTMHPIQQEKKTPKFFSKGSKRKYFDFPSLPFS